MTFYLGLISVLLMAFLTRMYFAQRENYQDSVKALTFKGLCTFIPVALCFYALFITNAPMVRWLLFAGVTICMIADVIIGMNFTAGMLAFLVAHLCFIAYFLYLAPYRLDSIILFVFIFFSVVNRFWRHVPSLGRKIVAFAAYPVVLTSMVSIAVVLPFQVHTPGTVCIAVGAVLFIISDAILADNTFNTVTKIKDRMVMYLYYSAVYLFAVSAFYM